MSIVAETYDDVSVDDTLVITVTDDANILGVEHGKCFTRNPAVHCQQRPIKHRRFCTDEGGVALDFIVLKIWDLLDT